MMSRRFARLLCRPALAGLRPSPFPGRTLGDGGGARRSLAVHLNRERRRYNGGTAEWWSERTFRFGRGCDSDQPSAILSYEIVTNFSMNQYLLGCPDTGVAAIIDAGDAEASLATAKTFGLEIKHLLQTHGHIDHIQGLADLKAKPEFREVPIYLHPADLVWYEHADMQASMFGLPLKQPPAPDVQLKDGDTIYIGKIPLKVMHTPGHCPGHVSFYCEPHGFVISGDLLFAGSVGRTDFPHSDGKEMRNSLRKILTLPDETKVFSGHMMPTTIGKERRTNPFLQGL